MSTPFKMKGSPMKRNFGIGASPVKQTQLFDTTGGESGTGTVHVGPFGSELKIEQEQRRKYGTQFSTLSHVKYPNKKTGWKKIINDIKSTIPKKEKTKEKTKE